MKYEVPVCEVITVSASDVLTLSLTEIKPDYIPEDTSTPVIPSGASNY